MVFVEAHSFDIIPGRSLMADVALVNLNALAATASLYATL